jgi:hypothetical protein
MFNYNKSYPFWFFSGVFQAEIVALEMDGGYRAINGFTLNVLFT